MHFFFFKIAQLFAFIVLLARFGVISELIDSRQNGILTPDRLNCPQQIKQAERPDG